jgi:hypothetical protein
MKPINATTVLLAVLAVTGFGFWQSDTLVSPALAATITKTSILEDPVAPKGYVPPR